LDQIMVLDQLEEARALQMMSWLFNTFILK